jgi:hypothetical protein
MCVSTPIPCSVLWTNVHSTSHSLTHSLTHYRKLWLLLFKSCCTTFFVAWPKTTDLSHRHTVYYYTHAYIHTYTPTHLHTYTHLHIHTHTHTYTYTHTHIPASRRESQWTYTLIRVGRCGVNVDKHQHLGVIPECVLQQVSQLWISVRHMLLSRGKGWYDISKWTEGPAYEEEWQDITPCSIVTIYHISRE